LVDQISRLKTFWSTRILFFCASFNL